MVEIPLTGGLVALVDDEDAHFAALKWFAQKSRRTYYAARSSSRTDDPRRQIQLHVEIMQCGPGIHVDHVNGNGLDCRRSNLRPATRSQNQGNVRLRRDNKTGFKGVAWRRSFGTWAATIYVDGRNRHLGTYATAEEAARAYDAAARKHHGPFACLNFPQPGECAALATAPSVAPPQSPEPTP